MEFADRRIEMNDVDQRIAQVYDPATANRYVVVYHNPHTSEQWLVARVLPGEVGRFKDALREQGCEIVIANQERGEWSSIAWLQHYRKDAPIREIAFNLSCLRH